MVVGDGVDDVDQRHVDVVDGLAQEAGLVLLDPFLNTAQDLLVGEVAGRDAEGLVAELQQLQLRLFLAGTVHVVAELGLGRARVLAQRLEQRLGLHDAVPEEMVDHLAAEVDVEVLVSAPQQIDDHHPFLLVLVAEILLGGLPFPRYLLQLQVQDGAADALGHGLQQLVLVLEEVAVLGLGNVVGVGDFNAADDLVLDPDIGALGAGGIDEVGADIRLVVVFDTHLANIGELVAAGYDLDHLGEDLGEGLIGPGQQLLDLVEAVELLGPLAHVVQQLVDRILRLVHRPPCSQIKKGAPPGAPQVSLSAYTQPLSLQAWATRLTAIM